MAQDTESFNNELYDLLKVRGYKPVPLNSQNQRVGASQQADVIEFTFIKDGEDYGKAWISVDDASHLKIYFDDEQQDSSDTKTPGVDYDDTWTGLLKHLKSWAQRRQLSFELKNKDRLGDDMRQRDYYKMKEKLGESKKINELSPEALARYNQASQKRSGDIQAAKFNKLGYSSAAGQNAQPSQTAQRLAKNTMDKEAARGQTAAPYNPEILPYSQEQGKRKAGQVLATQKINRKAAQQRDWERQATSKWDDPVMEGYHPMGKKASYNDAVPNVKIVLQHNRALEEGEQRYRNVARIFLENEEGERFLAPTTRPGIARVYARHIAEGGVPNDERWNHIKTVVEDYNKMAGFVRATRNGQFNESAQELVNEGVNHYNNLRETLKKMSGHRGYHAYFESWTPTLMEGEGEDLSEMFMSSSLDPRIESAMPILSRLKKPVTEMEEVSDLAEWADDIISEKLEMDSTTKTMAVPADKMLEAPGAETLAHNQSTEKKNLKAFGLAEEDKDDLPIGKGKNAYLVTTPDGKKIKVLADYDWQAKETAQKHWGLTSDAGVRVNPLTPDEPEKAPTEPTSKTPLDKAKDKTNGADKPSANSQSVLSKKIDWEPPGGRDAWADIARGAAAIFGVAEGDVVPFKKKKDDEEDWDDESWIPSIEDFEQEEEIRNRKRKPANDVEENFIGMAPQAVAEEEVEEGLDANQKRVGQLGPTEKVKNNNIGKLVGANESTEIDPELARIIEMARFKR